MHRIIHRISVWCTPRQAYRHVDVHDPDCPGCLGPRWAPDWNLIAYALASRERYTAETPA